MVRSCAVLGCSSSSRKKVLGVTYHRFPKDPSLCILWVQFSGNTKLIGKTTDDLARSSVICSKHFPPTAIEAHVGGNRLHGRHVPTLCLPSPIPIAGLQDVIVPPLTHAPFVAATFVRIVSKSPVAHVEDGIQEHRPDTVELLSSALEAIPSPNPCDSFPSALSSSNSNCSFSSPLSPYSDPLTLSLPPSQRDPADIEWTLAGAQQVTNMGWKCVVNGCPTARHYTEGEIAVIVGHKFPQNRTQRALWVRLSGNATLLTLNDKQLNRRVMCSRHFDAPGLKEVSNGFRLSGKGVLPTLCLPAPLSSRTLEPLDPSASEAAQEIIQIIKEEEVKLAEQEMEDYWFSSTEPDWEKMGRCCAVKGCQFRSKIYHSFPKDIRTTIKWIHLTGNRNMVGHTVKDLRHACICTYHFSMDDKIPCASNKSFRLKTKEVVPSVHLPKPLPKIAVTPVVVNRDGVKENTYQFIIDPNAKYASKTSTEVVTPAETLTETLTRHMMITKPHIKVNQNLFCRLCGNESESHEELIDIFGTESKEKNYPLIIKKVMPIKVTPDDKLPKQICMKCTVWLDAIVELREQVSEANKMLCNKFNVPTFEPLEETLDLDNARERVDDLESEKSWKPEDSNEIFEADPGSFSANVLPAIPRDESELLIPAKHFTVCEKTGRNILKPTAGVGVKRGADSMAPLNPAPAKQQILDNTQTPTAKTPQVMYILMPPKQPAADTKVLTVPPRTLPSGQNPPAYGNVTFTSVPKQTPVSVSIPPVEISKPNEQVDFSNPSTAGQYNMVFLQEPPLLVPFASQTKSEPPVVDLTETQLEENLEAATGLRFDSS